MGQGQTYSAKDPTVNILGIPGHTAPTTTIQLCCRIAKAAVAITYMEGPGGISIKLY